MAEITETHPIAPVLPVNPNIGIHREKPQQEKRQDREDHKDRHPDPDDGHHVDEYA